MENLSNLSNREIEILCFLKDGLSSKQIAKSLSLSSHTVDTHRRNMLKKSSANSTMELVMTGLKLGFFK